jgi:hypothetical protein
MVTTAVTTTLPMASANSWVNIVCVVLIIVIVGIIKKLTRDTLSERTKDVVYPILSAVLAGIGMGLGVIDISNVSDIIAYLVAPSGLWISINKIVGRK